MSKTNHGLASTELPGNMSQGADAAAASEPEPVRLDILGDDERAERIRKAAYARSEARGFEPGHEEEDWLAAEAEVESLKRV